MFELNLNDTVMVKITETGLAVMRENHQKLYRDLPHLVVKYPFREPDTDAEGWTTMQLWNVMQEFGASIAMGLPVPIETTIRYVGNGF